MKGKRYTDEFKKQAIKQVTGRKTNTIDNPSIHFRGPFIASTTLGYPPQQSYYIKVHKTIELNWISYEAVKPIECKIIQKRLIYSFGINQTGNIQQKIWQQRGKNIPGIYKYIIESF